MEKCIQKGSFLIYFKDLSKTVARGWQVGVTPHHVK